MFKPAGDTPPQKPPQQFSTKVSHMGGGKVLRSEGCSLLEQGPYQSWNKIFLHIFLIKYFFRKLEDKIRMATINTQNYYFLLQYVKLLHPRLRYSFYSCRKSSYWDNSIFKEIKRSKHFTENALYREII